MVHVGALLLPVIREMVHVWALLFPVLCALLLPVISEMGHVGSLLLPVIWEISSCECIITAGHLGIVSPGHLTIMSCRHFGNGSGECIVNPGPLGNGSCQSCCNCQHCPNHGRILVSIGIINYTL